MKPALVLLAAGASRRLGECKALCILGDRPVLAHLLSAGVILDEEPPLVVTGAHDVQIRAWLPEQVEPLYNPDWAAGRSGGIALAARARPDRDLLLAPVDCPLVPAAVFEALTHAWQEGGAPARGWLAPRLETAGGQRAPAPYGHPIVIGRGLLKELQSFPPDRPLRELRGSASPLWSVTTRCREILDDLNTPAQTAALRARLESAKSD